MRWSILVGCAWAGLVSLVAGQTAPMPLPNVTAPRGGAARDSAGVESTDLAAKRATLERKRAELARLQLEVRMLEAELARPTAPMHPAAPGVQVSLDVVVAELNLTKAREAGIDVKGFDHQKVHTGELSTDAETLLAPFKKANVVKVLAEPRLVAFTGQATTFESGDEVPVAVRTPSGALGIEYRKEGTRIDARIDLLANGKLRVAVRPSVTEFDRDRGVTINGTTIPAPRVRQVDTSIEIEPNKTFSLSGLIQHRIEKSRPKEAGILLIRPKAVEHVEEIQLLVLITPRLVEARTAGERSSEAPITPRR